MYPLIYLWINWAPTLHTAFPLSASPASRHFRGCLLCALLALLALTVAAPSLGVLPSGQGRRGGHEPEPGAWRSAKEDFGPVEWLALQSGYWQPRDYVKEVSGFCFVGGF